MTKTVKVSDQAYDHITGKAKYGESFATALDRLLLKK